MKKILYGICGIGLGHMYRQLPILEFLAKDHKIALFVYGESLKFCHAHFKNTANIKIIEVAVPYVVGDKDGLDFKKTAKHPANQPKNQKNFYSVNMKAFATAQDFLGKPDMVLTDYEPNAAQYAYAHDSPLYTLDQQSKYLVGDFPQELNGYRHIDEAQRLRLFFPKAHKRIVSSFFSFKVKPAFANEALVMSPLLRPELAKATPSPSANHYLIYLSAQQGFGQSIEQLQNLCYQHPHLRFTLYGKDAKENQDKNVVLRPHGHPDFVADLLTCEGLICTAGHSLLSEAVALGIPTLALPMGLYEQQMNAHQIEKNNWGISREFYQNNLPSPQTPTQQHRFF